MANVFKVQRSHSFLCFHLPLQSNNIQRIKLLVNLDYSQAELIISKFKILTKEFIKSAETIVHILHMPVKTLKFAFPKPEFHAVSRSIHPFFIPAYPVLRNIGGWILSQL